MTLKGLLRRVRKARNKIPQLTVSRLGVPPALVGYRYVNVESVGTYVERVRQEEPNSAVSYRTVHPAAVKTNPLPRNVMIRDLLPNRVGWWGYSFRDVPERFSDETFLATVPDTRVLHYIDAADEFYVALVNRDGRSMPLREIRMHPPHARLLRSSARTERIERATWFLERVYHNYSHWFTAHVPKLVLLKAEGRLDNLILPHKTNSVIETTLRLLGIDRRDYRTLIPDRVLHVDELTVLGTDRFRSELLRSVRDAVAVSPSKPPHRRIFISRAKAPRRRLVNEGDIWPLLERAGFERVIMEDLPFEAQLELMAETAILFAPHGAGLTNMMFCAPGTHVVEIADLTFPNPNFYAVASAMGHHYWLLSGTPIGNQHPLERDMAADPQEVKQLLKELLS